MADLTDIQAAQSVKVIGANSSGVETNPMNVDANGNAYTNLRKSDGTELVGRQLPATALPTMRAEPQTYSAVITDLVSAANATDIFTLTGSNSKTVRIHKIIISGTQTTHSWRNFLGIKRSTANTGGTSSTPTIVSRDSTNSAATAVVRAYTANPTLGTLVGVLINSKLSMPVATPTNAQGNGPGQPIVWDFNSYGQPIVLRGAAEIFAINLNTTSLAGPLINITIEWSEE